MLQISILFGIMTGWINGLVSSVWTPIVALLLISFALFEADDVFRRYRIRKRERCRVRQQELRSRIDGLATDEERVHYRVAPDFDERVVAETELASVQEELSRLNEKLVSPKTLSP
jgi:hypothetical protein